ncbi:MAG TPA: protein kinase [Bacteroidota bacterium]|nr:protein kinase [Bacteroidota bacterium]
MSVMVGKTVSHYEIIEELGSGAMGAVYKARDRKLERTVALKFLPGEFSRDPDAKKLFLNEARTSSSVLHRNICVVYDIDETDDAQMFISMEYVEGQALKSRLEGGLLPIQESVNIGLQLAAGLAKAHEVGIVHRDLKPANVMIARDGTVKILDFGLALSRAGSPGFASAGMLGTIAYMSPEQAQGGRIDQRTDVWSLGVVLYEMFTGRRPFPSEYAQAALYAIAHEGYPSIRTLRPDIPEALEKAVDKCLQKSPDDRFQSAGEILDELRRTGREQKAPAESAIKSIAVLPFSDISPDKDNQYFSDGLTEEIIAKLSRLPRLKIVSQNSVMHYERAGKTTRQIASELNVQYLLEGSVRKHGPSLRITTQLIDAAQDAYLWAETYNGTMDQIFDIQEDVASRIVKALKVRLTPDDRRTLKRRATENAEAYQLYLKGRYFWAKRTKDGLLAAIRHFEDAIGKDGRLAIAWAGIADSYILLADFVGESSKESYAKAKSAVHKALEIDSRLAEAHTSLGLLAMLSDWDWMAAEKEFKLAIAANPNYVIAHHWFAELLSVQARWKDSMSEISRALELDPLSPATLKDKGLIHYYAREYDSAIEYAQRALELEPGFSSAHRILSLAYSAKGMFPEAIREHGLWARDADRGFEGSAALAYCHALGGNSAEARKLLAQQPLRETAGGNLARLVALVHIALGEYEEGFSWLERAYEAKSGALGMLLVDPKLDPIRSDGRFASLLRRVRPDRGMKDKA